jgi:uncharacterized Fe-S center protein
MDLSNYLQCKACKLCINLCSSVPYTDSKYVKIVENYPNNTNQMCTACSSSFLVTKKAHDITDKLVLDIITRFKDVIRRKREEQLKDGNIIESALFEVFMT